MYYSTPKLFQLEVVNAIVLLSYLSSIQVSTKNTSVPKPCDFDCIHGRCDFQTRNCMCSPGWIGAGCELCALGLSCQEEAASLALILPQAASIHSVPEAQFVYAYGNAFPKGWDARYNCLFGASTSQGHWITSSLLRCPIPYGAGQQLPPGKHAFSLVSAGSTTQIVYQQEWGTSHFTIFMPCSADQCQGQCLGPLCLCPHPRSGQQCEVSNLTTLEDGETSEPVVKSIPSNETAITRANEFRPYLAKIPEWVNSSRVIVLSDTGGNGEGLTLDPVEGLLFWASPQGRSRPYSIGVRVEPPESTPFFVNWTLRVAPTYSAGLDRHLFLANNSNARELTGHVVWNTPGGKPRLNGSIPLLLRIAAANSATPTPIEDIPLWTEPREQTFRHLLFPYLGSADKIVITVHHPGSEPDSYLHSADLHDETDALEWTQERVEVSDFVREVRVSETTFSQNYSLRLAPLDGDCLAGWHFEVVEPRELYTIGESVLKEKSQSVQLTFRPVSSTLSSSPDSSLLLKTAFICMPTGQSQIVQQTLKGVGQNGGADKKTGIDVELDPKRLFIELGKDPLQSSTVIPLDISLAEAHSNLLQRANLESAAFSPFSLVWLSRPSPSSWRLWLALRADQLGGQRQNTDSDGAILIRGAENLALSVPYRIQRRGATTTADGQAGGGFLFTLTLKDPSGNSEPSLLSNNSDNINNNNIGRFVDVELFSQGREQHFVRSIQLDVPEQFGPIRSDLFQLRVRSRNFAPFSSLLKINPLDNALIVQLRRRPYQYFAHDGQQFMEGWDQLDVTDQIPVVQLRPSIIFPHAMDTPKFVDIVYSNGPPNSFVWLADQNEKNPSSLDLPMRNSTLCLGCGFRQPLRGLAFPKMADHCLAQSVSILFRQSTRTLPFRQHFLLSRNQTSMDDRPNNDEDFRDELPKEVICSSKAEGDQSQGTSAQSPPIALRTPLFRSCPLAKLRRCRSLFRPPGPRCQQWWRQMPDDLLSVHTLAQFVLLSADCRREGSSPEQMVALIRCISTVDRDCPLHPVEAEMAPHLGGQLFNQIGHLKPYRSGLQSLFPALSLIESQLASFPTILGDFLSQLNALFPPPAMSTLSSSFAFYEQFIGAIADNSTGGNNIKRTEVPAVEGEGRQSTEQLIQRWNGLVELLRGGIMDVLEEGDEKRQQLVQFRELVRRADRVKSATRQFGAENPFALYRDVLQRIFANARFHAEGTNTTAEGDRMEQTIGWADVRVEPEQALEGEELRILVNVRVREQTPLSLSSVRVQLRFFQPSPLKFRLGPIFTSGQSDHLNPGDTFRAEWTVLPVSEFRLTDAIKPRPDVVLAFELDGERKAQRLRAPSLLILPRPSLRLLMFGQPTVHPPPGHAPFTLLISAINSGYSELNSVELREMRAALQWSATVAGASSPVDFRISDVHVEGPSGDTVQDETSLSFGAKIPSGKAAHMALNISAISVPRGSNVALFRNFSTVISVNGGVLLPPAQFDQRFFLIQEAVPDHSLIVVSEHSSPLPLYLYSKQDTNLTPLATLQLIEEKESRPLLNGHRFLSRVFALRRLSLFPAPIAPDGSSSPSGESPSPPIGSVFATLQMDTARTFGDGAKLLRISELGYGRQRQLDRRLVWIGRDSNQKITLINFVDLNASAAVPQLFYEFLFGRPEHFRSPYFPQSNYQLNLSLSPEATPSGQEVLAKIAAISPMDSQLNYTLFSQEAEGPFSVVPTTGDIVLSHPLVSDPSEHCLNLVVTDSGGRQARVPVQILVSSDGKQLDGTRECRLFPAETKVYEHAFKLKQEAREMLETTPFTTIPPTATSTVETAETASSWYHPSSLSSPVVVEMGGDSTLSPITAFPGELVTTAGDDDGQQELLSYQTVPNDDTLTPYLATQEKILSTTTTPHSFVGFGGRTAPGRGFSFGGEQMQQRLRTTTSRTSFPAFHNAGGQKTSSGLSRKNGTADRVGVLTAQREGKSGQDESGQAANAQAMAEMACRLRSTKPIWALICDMAKTVYRATILNA